MILKRIQEDQLHSQTLWEAKEETTEIFASSLAKGEVWEDCRVPSIVLLFKIGSKDKLGNQVGDVNGGKIVGRGLRDRIYQDLSSLESRRLRGDIIRVNKIMRSMNKVNTHSIFPR